MNDVSFTNLNTTLTIPPMLKDEIKMSKYSFLGIIYLFSVVSSSIANSLVGNIQDLYRVPFLKIRWIDISILFVVFSFFYSLPSTRRRLKNTNFIIFLCFIYLIFESFQLWRSWGLNDLSSEVSHFLCTLSLFIIVDLSFYAPSINTIISFLKKFAIWGAFTLIISNLYLLYSFISGNTIFTDSDIRVGLEVAGSKETVSQFVLVPFVYAFGLYFVFQKKAALWKKILFLCAIFSIYGALVITFGRGTLASIIIVSIYFLFSSTKPKEVILKIGAILLLIVIGYLIFDNAFAKRGYDPINKIVQIAEFATDVKNPDWDKGRSISHEYAIAAWKKNIWIGAGYNDLYHYGMPDNVATAHNGIITSLFHRGILGTLILMLILFLLFKHSIKLWFLIRKKNDHESDIIKLLIVVSFLWIITFLTQEALWEKYSLSIEFMYLGLIYNYYIQLRNKPKYYYFHQTIKNPLVNELPKNFNCNTIV